MIRFWGRKSTLKWHAKLFHQDTTCALHFHTIKPDIVYTRIMDSYIILVLHPNHCISSSLTRNCIILSQETQILLVKTGWSFNRDLPKITLIFYTFESEIARYINVAQYRWTLSDFLKVLAASKCSWSICDKHTYIYIYIYI